MSTRPGLATQPFSNQEERVSLLVIPPFLSSPGDLFSFTSLENLGHSGTISLLEISLTWQNHSNFKTRCRSPSISSPSSIYLYICSICIIQYIQNLDQMPVPCSIPPPPPSLLLPYCPDHHRHQSHRGLSSPLAGRHHHLSKCCNICKIS